jgi:hypothetical protein
VACEVLDDAHFVKHNNLRHEGYGLEPERETPCKCPDFPSGVQNTSRNKGNWNEDLKVGELIAK